MNQFETWLKTTKFAKQYYGPKDKLSEAFTYWLAQVDIYEWLVYGQEYAEDYAALKFKK